MSRIFTSTKDNKTPEHPGLILERAMKDQNLTPPAFAKAIGISKMELDRLFQAKTHITRATAGKFGRYFGNGSGAWMKMQTLWDERED